MKAKKKKKKLKKEHERMLLSDRLEEAVTAVDGIITETDHVVVVTIPKENFDPGQDIDLDDIPEGARKNILDENPDLADCECVNPKNNGE